MEYARLQLPHSDSTGTTLRNDSRTAYFPGRNTARRRTFHHLSHRFFADTCITCLAKLASRRTVKRASTCRHDSNRNFNEKDFLTLGFNGSQPGISDYYTNNGSLYMASLAFLPLGLPADDPFWTDASQPWTSKKAWDGEDFPRDHSYHEE